MGNTCLKDTIKADTVVLMGDANFNAINESVSKYTPCHYLITQPIRRENVPSFVLEFYDIANGGHYGQVMQNHHKDIFFCNDIVYTIEKAKQCVYENVKKLQEATTIFNNILTPSEVYFHPFNDKYGIMFQKMLYCNIGDLWTFCFKRNGSLTLNIDHLVSSLASTLKVLHGMNIFLMDIKLENIFGHIVNNSIIWMFGDTEYAFVNAPFVKEGTSNAPYFEKFKWVRTLEYIPTREYPHCKRIAERNDCFALARCLGTVIMFMHTGKANCMFNGNKSLIIYDCREDVNCKFPNDKYLPLLGDCVVEYNKYANDCFLSKLMDISDS